MPDKKKNKKLLIIGGVVAGVVIIGLFITVRINNYLKEKRKSKQKTAIVEPEINAEQERKGHRTLNDQSVLDIFNGDIGPDSIPGDTISNDILLVSNQLDSVDVEKEPAKNPVQKKVKKQAVKNAFSKSIAEEQAKKNKPKPVYKPKAKPKPKKYRENVKFNFVVVKEDPQVTISNTEVEKEEANEVDLTQLAEGRIYGSKILKHNEPVKLRTIEKVKIGKKKYIPEGALLFGVARFTNNRFKIHITRAMTEKGNFPCEILVYDSYDFQEGIFVQGANIDVQPEEGVGDVVEEVGDVMPNQLIGSSVKGVSKLVQRDVKKMKKITATVPDNYTVYLLDNSQKKKK